MPTADLPLLDATIAHLEALKLQGVTWLPVRRETLEALSGPAERPGVPLKAFSPPTALPTAPPVGRTERLVSSSSSRSPESMPEGVPVPPPVEGKAPSLNPAALTRWAKAVSPMPKVSSSSAPLSSRTPLPAPLPAEARVAALEDLRTRILACSVCSHLASSRHSVVFGVGDPFARILFVGEAPGADEDLRGEPFVGKAGELLTKIITAMGLTRESVFIANILKCRPDTPGQTSGNRKPKPEEMATCFPWLEQQIDLIQPQVLVALGATAVEGLLGKGLAGITLLRGSWKAHRGIPVMPTYHPAYLLRNQALSEKRKVWEDMMQVLERAGYPITDKQRGFFLSRD